MRFSRWQRRDSLACSTTGGMNFSRMAKYQEYPSISQLPPFTKNIANVRLA
jgi:hypothetical protein